MVTRARTIKYSSLVHPNIHLATRLINHFSRLITIMIVSSQNSSHFSFCSLSAVKHTHTHTHQLYSQFHNIIRCCHLLRMIVWMPFFNYFCYRFLILSRPPRSLSLSFCRIWISIIYTYKKKFRLIWIQYTGKENSSALKVWNLVKSINQKR